MLRVATMATAAIVAVAVAALPLVMDRCAETCEMHTAAPPSCHHSTSTATHVGQVPAPCGHDHHVVVAAADTIPRAASWFAPMAMIGIARAPIVGASADGRSLESPPRVQSASRTQSLPLRI